MPKKKRSPAGTLEKAKAKCEDAVIDAACDIVCDGVTKNALAQLVRAVRAVQRLEKLRDTVRLPTLKKQQK